MRIYEPTRQWLWGASPRLARLLSRLRHRSRRTPAERDVPADAPQQPGPEVFSSAHHDLERQLRRIRNRVEALEREVQENRRLNRRIAELTDLVQEVLLPATQRDDDRLRTLLDEYAKDHQHRG